MIQKHLNGWSHEQVGVGKVIPCLMGFEMILGLLLERAGVWEFLPKSFTGVVPPKVRDTYVKEGRLFQHKRRWLVKS